MLGAFADRKHVRRAGLQMVVDHDAAVDGNAGLLRQRDVRPDAGREDHGVGIDPAAVHQFDAFDARLAMDARGVGVEQDLRCPCARPAISTVRPRAHRAGAPSGGPSDAPASPARRPWRDHRPLPRPSSPPPTTTTRFFCAASVSSRSTSRLSRNVCTPARSAPGTLSRSADEPVVSTSFENGMLSSFAILSSRRPTSISVAMQPYFRVTPRSRHQDAGRSSMSCEVVSPASTDDSSTRL